MSDGGAFQFLKRMTSLFREDKKLSYLIAIAFSVRLITWLGGMADATLFLTPDSLDYLRLSETLIDAGKYGSVSDPEVFRVPGYVLFLSAFSTIGLGPAAICFFQIIIDVGICVLVYVAGTKLGGKKQGFVGSIFQSLSIVSIVFSCKILSETCFAFALLILIISTIECLYFDSKKWNLRTFFTAVCVGVLLVLLTYIRAVTILYIGVPLVVFLLAKKWKVFGIVSLVYVLGVGPWIIRNNIVANYPSFSSVGAINLYRYNATLVTAHLRGISFQEAFGDADIELAKYETQADAAQFAMREGKRVISENLLLASWLHFKADRSNLLPAVGDWMNFFGCDVGGNGTMAVVHSDGLIAGVRHYFGGSLVAAGVAIPFCFWLAGTYALAVLGCYRAFFRREQVLVHVLLILTIGYFLLVPGAPSHPRFRVPVTPLISLYGGLGYCWVMSRVRKAPIAEAESDQ